MSKSIICISCGASCQLPAGENHLNCNFCGTYNQIESEKEKSSLDSLIRSKPLVTYRKLDLENRNINSFLEVVSWFSNNELSEIEIVNLKNNNISNFEGLDKLKPKQLDLSNNKINSTSGLSKVYIENVLDISNNNITTFDSFPRGYKSIYIVLTNNEGFHSFSGTFDDDIISYILPKNKCTISFYLIGCKNFDGISLKNSIERIKTLSCQCQIRLITDAGYSNSDVLLNMGFILKPNLPNDKILEFEFNHNFQKTIIYNETSNGKRNNSQQSEENKSFDFILSFLFWPFYGWYKKYKNK